MNAKHIKRGLIAAVAVAATTALAACGSSGSTGAAHGSGGTTGTVAAKQVGGVGMVLVDASGRTLYTPDQEANGMVLCTGACTTVWVPVAAQGTPSAGPGVAQLGVITRSDGSKQVTAKGKPLYTFAPDSPGQVKGNNVSDASGSQHFTWHAVLANGTLAAATPSSATTAPTSTTSGYGY